MPIFLRRFLQYAVPIVAAGGLLWFAYKDTDLQALGHTFRTANYFWIALSTVPALVSSLSRAIRWQLLLRPAGHTPGLWTTFLATMSGYFANLLLPRMGEVTRCGVLQHTDRVPLTTSLGTVVAERAVDLLTLLLLTGATLLLEFRRVSAFLFPLFAARLGNWQTALGPLLVAGVSVLLLVLAGVYLVRHYRTWLENQPLTAKIRAFVQNVWTGLLSIRRLRQRGAFLFHTVLIWTCYLAMAYLAFQALPETATLPPVATLTILMVGSLGMVAPVQGGVGAYHIMVSGGLMLYAVPEVAANASAALMHTSQTLFYLVLGGLCFLLTLSYRKKNADHTPYTRPFPR